MQDILDGKKVSKLLKRLGSTPTNGLMMEIPWRSSGEGGGSIRCNRYLPYRIATMCINHTKNHPPIANKATANAQKWAILILT